MWVVVSFFETHFRRMQSVCVFDVYLCLRSSKLGDFICLTQIDGLLFYLFILAVSKRQEGFHVSNCDKIKYITNVLIKSLLYPFERLVVGFFFGLGVKANLCAPFLSNNCI